ncbi:COQ9 family protein [Novosphingobium umbonatum]|uniref:COQ9 family protein n=1 Tax=Novosphingobium umbonatum TaxID=1908524 RepID=A0A3S2X3C0_9SPHN|nr:COQ9 family protein [Novosphingobium umbonatum]RVU04679.1 COQ9 family protein [Novosphingobium umbonatum]
MTDTPLADLSLEDLRIALAPAVARAAVFDGWSEEAVRSAALEQGVDEAVALYAFADGAMAMITAWTAHIDAAMVEALPAEMLAGLSIRERIRRQIRFRLEAQAGMEESLRSALSIMARPLNVAAAAKLAWHSADLMWRQAGDRAVDYNHYTKRMTLSAIYAASLAVFMDDHSEDKAESWAFLDRRIEGVMRFEKLKSQLTPKSNMHFSPMRLLGRLRYPAH